MAAERLERHVLREIFRQKLALARAHRQIVTSLGVSLGKVSGALARASAIGLDAVAIEQLTDDELEAALYPKTVAAAARAVPDCAALHIELRRSKVTLALLHVGRIASPGLRIASPGLLPGGARCLINVATSRHVRRQQKRERPMGKASRQELVEAVRQRYVTAERSDNGRILNEFVALMGFHRKHSIRLLRVGRSCLRLPRLPS